MFATGAGKFRHRGPHVRSAQPLAVGTELKCAKLGLVFDDVYRGEQGRRIDPVEGDRDPVRDRRFGHSDVC
jgi:hypothetical protein